MRSAVVLLLSGCSHENQKPGYFFIAVSLFKVIGIMSAVLNEKQFSV